MKSISLILMLLLAGAAWGRTAKATLPWGKPAPNTPATVTITADDEPVARVALGYDRDALYLRYQVEDDSPLKNRGDNERMLFKTGDSVDLQLGLDSAADPTRDKPVPGDVRLLLTRTAKGPIAVCYRYVVPGTKEPVLFASPTGRVTVDRVEVLAKVTITVRKRKTGYTLTAVVPWAALAGAPYTPKPGTVLRGDVGVLLGDPDGGATVERLYWANRHTAIVADVPSEIVLPVTEWGSFTLGEEKKP